MSVSTKPKEENVVWETTSVIIQALVLALILRTFLFQPFNIPSGSMKPTLLVGDYIFVSKWSYGFSHHSLPFSPKIFSGRIWGSDPERGDVVVFKYPNDTSKDYIKRLIGLPGDKVQLKDSVVLINGQPVARKQEGSFTDTGASAGVPVFTETQKKRERHTPRLTFNPAIMRIILLYLMCRKGIISSLGTIGIILQTVGLMLAWFLLKTWSVKRR